MKKPSTEFGSIYDNIPVMLCVVDKSRKIVDANQALCEFVRKSRKDLIGGVAFGALGCVNSWPDGNVCGLGAECGNCSFHRRIQNSFAASAPFQNDEHEMKLIIDGIPKTVTFLASGSLISHFDTPALLISLQDITHLKKAESAFLSTMGHEFRTPMNAILGFSQVLESENLPKKHQREYVQEIIKAGKYLLELTNDVLNLTKIDSGKISVTTCPIEAAGLMNECINLVRQEAAKRKITVKNTIPGPLQVYADRQRLKQVLLNLLSNAVKYNREGGRVWIDSEDFENSVRIRINDTGPGIPLHRLHELFEPFNRLEAENSEIEGTGIGLAISKKLTELMGGSIGVENREEPGSTFFIELPKTEASA